MSQLTDQSRALAPSKATVIWNTAWPMLIALVIGVAMYRWAGPALGGFSGKVALIAGINIILAVSLTVVNGFTGQFSIGHAGFMAVGGYVAAWITYYGSIKLFGSAEFAGGALSMVDASSAAWFARGDLLFVMSCLAGGVAAAAAGWVVGLPSLRLRGDYLAIVTLGFGEIVRVLLQGTQDQVQPWRAQEAIDAPWWKLVPMVGGPKGFNLLPTYTTLFWVYAFVVITLLVCYRVKTSSTGRAFLSIREDEIAAQAMGVDVTKYKVRAFVLSSFFAGLAGGLYAMDIGAINAGDLGFQKSFDILIMVVLGGLGSISGAALAAVVLTILPEVLRDPPSVMPLGIVLLGVMTVVMIARKRPRVLPLVIVAVVTVAVEVARRLALKYDVQIADYRLILYSLLLIGMMILRPQGLFGIREIWEVFGRKGKL